MRKRFFRFGAISRLVGLGGAAAGVDLTGDGRKWPEELTLTAGGISLESVCCCLDALPYMSAEVATSTSLWRVVVALEAELNELVEDCRSGGSLLDFETLKLRV